MYVDKANMFSDSQAVTAAAASTNIVDLGVATRDIGSGQDVYLVVNCTVAMTDGGSDSTLAVILQQDTDEAMGTVETAQTIGTFPAVSAAGTRFVAKLQPLAVYKRYLRVYYTPANGNLTTGSFDAFLTTDVDTFRSYADAITIS